MEQNASQKDFSGYLFDVVAGPKTPRAAKPVTPTVPAAKFEEYTDFLQLGAAECDISIARWHEWGSKQSKWTVYPVDQRPEGFIACDKDGKWCKKAAKPRWDEHAINDPRRPDWGIFAELLQRPLPVPSDKNDARWALKQAILDAYQRDAGKSLMRACAKRQLSGFEKEFRNSNDALDTLSQRLLNISAQATPSNAKKIKDPTQGNSNYCLHYWEPTKGGVVQYVAFRVGAIISDIVEERKNEPKTVSLNALAEKNIEVTSNGTLIHAEAFASIEETDDVGDNPAGPPMTEEKRAERDRRLMGGARPQMRPEWKRKDSPEQLASKGRSDYDYFSILTGTRVKPAKTPEARSAQVKELAKAVVESVLPNLEQDEQDAVREDIENWDPTQDTFTRHFPDVAENAFKAKFSDPIEIDEKAAAAAVLGYGDAPDNKASKADHLAHADAQIRESAVWLARANIEDLSDPARPDYQFFCERMNEEPDEDLRGPALHARVKEMAMQWTGLTLQNQPHGPYVMRRVKDWDAGKDGFYHEMIQEMLGERPRALMDTLDPEKAERARAKMVEKVASTIAKQEELAARDRGQVTLGL